MDLEYDDRAATAFHETGHGWMNAVTGVPMRKIHMWKGFMTTHGGEVCFDRAKHAGFFESDFDMMAMGYLAGQEAESLWLVRTYGIDMEEARSITKAGARLDLRMVDGILSCVPDMNKQHCQRVVDAVLLRHWQAIDILASRMRERMSLNPDRVVAAADREKTNGLEVRRVKLVTPEMMAEAVPGYR